MAQDGCGSQGGARGNRKRRPRSVSPLLELASLKVCFHFQNESEGGEVSPSLPGLSPLQDTDARTLRACGRAGGGAVAELAELAELFAALLAPKPLPVPLRCWGRAAHAASVSHPAAEAVGSAASLRL